MAARALSLVEVVSALSDSILGGGLQPAPELLTLRHPNRSHTTTVCMILDVPREGGDRGGAGKSVWGGGYTATRRAPPAKPGGAAAPAAGKQSGWSSSGGISAGKQSDCPLTGPTRTELITKGPCAHRQRRHRKSSALASTPGRCKPADPCVYSRTRCLHS